MWSGPYRIVARGSDVDPDLSIDKPHASTVTYWLDNPKTGNAVGGRVHANRLKKYIRAEDEDWLEQPRPSLKEFFAQWKPEAEQTYRPDEAQDLAEEPQPEADDEEVALVAADDVSRPSLRPEPHRETEDQPYRAMQAQKEATKLLKEILARAGPCAEEEALSLLLPPHSSAILALSTWNSQREPSTASSESYSQAQQTTEPEQATLTGATEQTSSSPPTAHLVSASSSGVSVRSFPKSSEQHLPRPSATKSIGQNELTDQPDRFPPAEPSTDPVTTNSHSREVEAAHRCVGKQRPRQANATADQKTPFQLAVLLLLALSSFTQVAHAHLLPPFNQPSSLPTSSLGAMPTSPHVLNNPTSKVEWSTNDIRRASWYTQGASIPEPLSAHPPPLNIGLRVESTNSLPTVEKFAEALAAIGGTLKVDVEAIPPDASDPKPAAGAAYLARMIVFFGDMKVEDKVGFPKSLLVARAAASGHADHAVLIALRELSMAGLRNRILNLAATDALARLNPPFWIRVPELLGRGEEFPPALLEDAREDAGDAVSGWWTTLEPGLAAYEDSLFRLEEILAQAWMVKTFALLADNSKEATTRYGADGWPLITAAQVRYAKLKYLPGTDAVGWGTALQDLTQKLTNLIVSPPGSFAKDPKREARRKEAAEQADEVWRDTMTKLSRMRESVERCEFEEQEHYDCSVKAAEERAQYEADLRAWKEKGGEASGGDQPMVPGILTSGLSIRKVRPGEERPSFQNLLAGIDNLLGWEDFFENAEPRTDDEGKPIDELSKLAVFRKTYWPHLIRTKQTPKTQVGLRGPFTNDPSGWPMEGDGIFDEGFVPLFATPNADFCEMAKESRIFEKRSGWRKDAQRRLERIAERANETFKDFRWVNKAREAAEDGQNEWCEKYISGGPADGPGAGGIRDFYYMNKVSPSFTAKRARDDPPSPPKPLPRRVPPPPPPLQVQNPPLHFPSSRQPAWTPEQQRVQAQYGGAAQYAMQGPSSHYAPAGHAQYAPTHYAPTQYAQSQYAPTAYGGDNDKFGGGLGGDFGGEVGASAFGAGGVGAAGPGPGGAPPLFQKPMPNPEPRMRAERAKQRRREKGKEKQKPW
ncbi:hypothetical protein JCM11251_007341 [Rhodosporidiobolus azoricus]